MYQRAFPPIAERMGFEPMVQCYPHTDLANRRFDHSATSPVKNPSAALKAA